MSEVSPASPPAGLDERLVVATSGQMRALGARLARVLRASDLVVLSGPLGAGKTTLAQGIGAGLDIRGQVTSPTFVIARVHPSLQGGPDLVHADAYRLGSRAEVDDLDLDADLETAVTVVEWGEGLVEELASSFLAVDIRADGDMTAARSPNDMDGAARSDVDVPRTLRVRGFGNRWEDPSAATAIRQALTGPPEGRS